MGPKRRTLKQNTPLASSPEPFVDINAVARHLGVARQTVENWKCAGKKLPTHRITRKVVRYRLSEIDAWVAAGAR